MIASQKNTEWEGAGVPEAPTAPDSLRQAGLSLNFLNDLLMRTLYVNGVMLGLDIARNVCLPFKVIEESLKFLKDEKCVEVQGGDLIGRAAGCLDDETAVAGIARPEMLGEMEHVRPLLG